MNVETQSPPETEATDVDTSAEEILTGHSYDGIQEYDNPLPGWWKFLFWVTILFSPVYFIYFHLGVEGRSIHDQYDQHMAQVFELRFGEIGDLEADRATLMEYMKKPKWLSVGRVVYKTNCASCHGPDGGGLTGPNLTDDHWKNVRNIEDIANVIANGAANGSMPAWKTRMSHQNQIVLTAAYIATLRDKPVVGKPPEGDKILPWSE